MKLWVATFKDGKPDVSYLAVGKDNLGMRVYEIDMEGEASPRLTRMSFPACLRFIHVTEGRDPQQRSLGWIKENYGDLPKLREALDAEEPFEVIKSTAELDKYLNNPPADETL